MPYEFITKNGLISQGNVTVTGSLITSQNVTASNISASGTVIATSFTGSLLGTSSWASNALTASFLPVGTYNITSSWANNVVSASYATTAQTANALNASNTYSIAGLTSAYVDVTGAGTIPSTGIYRPSSKTLGLSADATLILKINGSVSPYVTSIESGNVGIGSSSPTSKFEVLTSAVALANQPNIIGNFRGDTDGRSLIRVDNTSTSAGAAALQAGISFVAYSNVSSQPSANKHEAQIILGSTGATSVPGGQTGTLQIVAPQDIAFNVSASNIIMTGSSYTTFGYNAMYINRAGNIGIGTTNPSSRLHISGSSATAITITDDALYTNSITNDNSVMTYTVDTGNAAASSAAHIFKRFNTELVRITHEGRVGVGTSIPATGFLDVRSNQSKSLAGPTNIAFFGSNDAANPLGLAVNHESSSGVKMVGLVGTEYGSSGNNIKINETIHVQYTGNVGIRTINPVATLQVAGNVSGSSFTSSISNAVGFLGTSSWANNVVSASYALTSSFATRAQTANALNALNTYSIAGLTSAYVDVDGSSAPTTGIYRPSTKTLGLSADSTLIFKISNVSAPATSSIETGNFVVQSGNVGLGTNSPNNKLDIFGATGTTLNMSNVDDGSRGGKLTFISSSATGRQFYVGTNSSIYNLVFGIDSIERARIDTSGNLGIGITSPTVRLHVSGSSIITNPNPSANSAVLLVQDEGTATTVKDGTTLRIVNNGSAANFSVFEASSAVSDFVILNNGNVGIGTTTPGALLELSSSTAASLLNIKGARGNNILYVSGSGNIGINSVAFDPLAPEALLISGSTYNIISADTNINTYGQVHTQNRNAGTAASSDLVATNDTGNEVGNYVDMGINSSGYTAAFIGNANDGYLYNTGSQFYIGNASPGRNLYFFAGGTTNTASMMLSASGNVGIGATSPNAKLDVRGYIVSDVNGNAVESGFYLGSSAHGIRRPVASNDVYLHTTTGNLYLGTTGNTSQQVTVLNSGNVGIGTVTPAAKLEISGSGNSALLNIKSPISGAILYVSGSGAVGINTTTVGAFTLQVNGSFGATTKSFIIDHPTKAGKKLMYGSLESPYHGIRLTGRDTLKEGKCKVELPDYIYKLILHDSVNIQLTGIKCNKTLYVDDINIPENYFTIAYDKAIFESYKDYDFFWDFTAIRADVPELTTEL